MVPPRRPVAPIADSLTEDEKALMLVAVRLDSALRHHDKEPGCYGTTCELLLYGYDSR